MRASPAVALLLVSGCSFAFVRRVAPAAPALTDASADLCSGASVTATLDAVNAGVLALTGLVGIPMAAGLSAFGDDPLDTRDLLTMELAVGGLAAVSALSARWGFDVAADCRDQRRAYRAAHPALAAAPGTPTPTSAPAPP